MTLSFPRHPHRHPRPQRQRQNHAAGNLTRLLDPCSGHITISGIDTRTLRRRDVRAALTVVPQDVYAFPGTVRANLDLAGGCADDELLGVLARLGLAGVVRGLDDELEWGRMSVGQRQLFSSGARWSRRVDGGGGRGAGAGRGDE